MAVERNGKLLAANALKLPLMAVERNRKNGEYSYLSQVYPNRDERRNGQVSYPDKGNELVQR